MALAKHGPDYLERYVDARVAGTSAHPSPGQLHGIAAKLIRELVLDAEVGR